MTKIPAQGHESVIASWKAEETGRFLAAMVHSVIQAINRRHGCRVDLAQRHQIEDTNRRIDRTSRTRERSSRLKKKQCSWDRLSPGEKRLDGGVAIDCNEFLVPFIG